MEDNRRMPASPRAVGIAAAVTTILIWTLYIVIARAMALRSLSPYDIVLCRIIGAAVVLLPWGWLMMRRRRAADPALRGWLGLSPYGLRLTATIGIPAGLGYALFAYTGFVYAPAAHGSVLLPGMLPLMTALIATRLLHEPIGPGRRVGLALILAGGALVGGTSLLTAFEGGDVWKGDLLFLCASVCWSFYAVTCRRHRLDAVQATIAVTVFAALTYVPVYGALALSGLVDSRLATAPWGEIAFQAAWQGVGSVVISGITFMKMVQVFGPVRSTMLTALVPGLSATAAVIFLGEPLGLNLIAGLALVTLGIVVGVRAASMATPVSAAPAVPAVLPESGPPR
jgi:drug/metabolite transporter (DMT)-like permease